MIMKSVSPGAKTILDGESNARLGEFLRSLSATYGQSDWVIAGMKATAASWVYEYEYRAEYLPMPCLTVTLIGRMILSVIVVVATAETG